MEGIFEVIFRIVIDGIFMSEFIENWPYANAFLKFIITTIVMIIFLGIISFISSWKIEEFISKLIYPVLFGVFAAIVSLVFVRKK